MYFVFILALTIRYGGYCERVMKKMDIDKKTPSYHINYVLGVHEEVCNEMVACLTPREFVSIFAEMNANNFGRAVAYLPLVDEHF